MDVWVLGVLGVLATLWVYWRQNQKLKLTLNAVSLNLIDLESESKKHVKDKLTVHWGEKRILKLDVTEVSISNDSKAISEQDFVVPLVIKFDDAEILDAKVVELNPKDMNLSISVSGSSISVKLPLINKGECVTINVVTNNLKPTSEIFGEARIRNGVVINRHLIYGRRFLLQKLLTIWDSIIGLLVIPFGLVVYYFFFADKSAINLDWNKIKELVVFLLKFGFTVIGSGFLLLFVGYLPRWFFERRK